MHELNLNKMSHPSKKLKAEKQKGTNAADKKEDNASMQMQKTSKKVEDLEVKDAQLIFQTVWHELEVTNE